jgi:hypothetical protein
MMNPPAWVSAYKGVSGTVAGHAVNEKDSKVTLT